LAFFEASAFDAADGEDFGEVVIKHFFVGGLLESPLDFVDNGVAVLWELLEDASWDTAFAETFESDLSTDLSVGLCEQLIDALGGDFKRYFSLGFADLFNL
jgi:hypothetical protein